MATTLLTLRSRLLPQIQQRLTIGRAQPLHTNSHTPVALVSIFWDGERRDMVVRLLLVFALIARVSRGAALYTREGPQVSGEETL